MKYSTFVIMFAIFAYSLLFNINDDVSNTNNENVTNDGLVFMFLSKTKAFDDYFNDNPNISGDVTASVPYQGWLPINDSVKMVVTDGVGYVYFPAKRGVYSLLLAKTSGSAFMGYSDDTSINTPVGKILKPSYIPVNSIVYMR